MALFKIPVWGKVLFSAFFYYYYIDVVYAYMSEYHICVWSQLKQEEDIRYP